MTENFFTDGASLPIQTISILQAHSQADRETLLAVQYAARQLCVQKDDTGMPIDPVQREIYLSLMETCYRLQRQIACSEELLSYEKGLRNTAVEFDLCRILRRFVNLIEELTDGRIAIGACTIPHGLYARMHPERLNFTLLHMMERMLWEMPEANMMDFSAKCVQKDLRIEMRFWRDPDRNSEPLQFLTPVDEKGMLPDSPINLTKYFCECYQARILRQASDGKPVCSLVLPAARALNPLLKVSSDSAKLLDDTLFRAVLSNFVSVETMLTSASDWE